MQSRLPLGPGKFHVVVLVRIRISMHARSSSIGGLVSCKHVFRKGIHSEVVLNEHLEKMLFTELSVRQVVRGFF